MTSPLPLLIVMCTIVALVGIQRLLLHITNLGGIAAISPKPEQAPVKAAAQPTALPRGRSLLPGLSVVGLDDRGLSSLRALIKKGDITPLTTFLAFNRPNILELDDYLKKNRQIFKATLSAAPKTLSTEQLEALASEFHPEPAPAGMHFDWLTRAERCQALVFEPRARRLINRDLMTRFGGHDFHKHFPRYCALEKATTLHVPPFDPDRPTFEALAESGIADKGRQIPLPQRLMVLKMKELRQMAKDLNYDQKFTRKIDATEDLATRPGAAVLLSMQYVIDDLFYLNPIEDTDKIEEEWAYLSACARLLASTNNQRRTLEQSG